MRTKTPEKRKTAIIIGAGPAGLTAGIELLRQTDIIPILLEEKDCVGGLSRTVFYHGNRMDIGGHRFFSKDPDIMKWWTTLLPLQGSPAQDDLLTPCMKTFVPGGPDPEKEDRTMLLRRRISRIFYLKKFFDYPVTFNAKTILNLGLGRTVRAAIGYLRATLSKRPELSLQDFYINRFGRPLYKMFFEHYTEKVWGVHPSVLGADWGAQRVNGLSIKALLKNMLVRKKRTPGDIRQKDTEKSLIENFLYPKFGPGQLWETAAQEIERDEKGTILLKHRLVRIHYEGGLIRSVTAATPDGHVDIPCDYVLSSMPVKDLVSTFTGITVPPEVFSVATSLPYRDFITVGILVDRLKIRHNGQPPTFGNRIPDTWIYIQERDVRIGRLQVFNNWSPYLVEDYRNCIWLGLEYFCNENDELWNKTDRDFISMAIGELVHIGILEDETHVKDSTIVREKKAYPAYHGSYRRLKEVTAWLDRIPNLYCIGRNGQHRYNNMDHSMLTAMEAVAHIRDGKTDKQDIWNINTEQEYHERKKH
ncbi:NAD(P)/FAD-dependent oxidoreductase [Paraprevotella clara]